MEAGRTFQAERTEVKGRPWLALVCRGSLMCLELACSLCPGRNWLYW